MKIEESIEIVQKEAEEIKNGKGLYYLYYDETLDDRKRTAEAIETLLTAYEKEKEKNKKEYDRGYKDGFVKGVQPQIFENWNKENARIINIKSQFISKDKLKVMLNGYKKALKDVEEAIGVLKSNILIVADEKHKKEIEKELTFRERDKISKIIIINLLEDLLKEE